MLFPEPLGIETNQAIHIVERFFPKGKEDLKEAKLIKASSCNTHVEEKRIL